MFRRPHWLISRRIHRHGERQLHGLNPGVYAEDHARVERQFPQHGHKQDERHDGDVEEDRIAPERTLITPWVFVGSS